MQTDDSETQLEHLMKPMKFLLYAVFKYSDVYKQMVYDRQTK